MRTHYHNFVSIFKLTKIPLPSSSSVMGGLFQQHILKYWCATNIICSIAIFCDLWFSNMLSSRNNRTIVTPTLCLFQLLKLFINHVLGSHWVSISVCGKVSMYFSIELRFKPVTFKSWMLRKSVTYMFLYLNITSLDLVTSMCMLRSIYFVDLFPQCKLLLKRFHLLMHVTDVAWLFSSFWWTCIP